MDGWMFSAAALALSLGGSWGCDGEWRRFAHLSSQCSQLSCGSSLCGRRIHRDRHNHLAEAGRRNAASIVRGPLHCSQLEQQLRCHEKHPVCQLPPRVQPPADQLAASPPRPAMNRSGESSRKFPPSISSQPEPGALASQAPDGGGRRVAATQRRAASSAHCRWCRPSRRSQRIDRDGLGSSGVLPRSFPTRFFCCCP